jgi:hypothetical protein
VGAFDIIFDIHNVASLLRVMHVVPSPVTEANEPVSHKSGDYRRVFRPREKKTAKFNPIVLNNHRL